MHNKQDLYDLIDFYKFVLANIRRSDCGRPDVTNSRKFPKLYKVPASKIVQKTIRYLETALQNEVL